jgi:tetratricopeptide (TPR) repeat protein
MPMDIPPAGGGSGELAEARAAMAARDFERVVQITTEILTNDLMNDEARVLADEAREKMEAGPFIDQFVRKCDQNLKNGNVAAARTDLEKARALDSSHPGVRKMEQMIATKEGAAPSSFDASSFVVDTPSAGSRAGSQASDFGFTFEEEKAPAAAQQPSFANFSFDTPATPPAGSQDASGFSGFSFDAPAATTPAASSSFSFDAPAEAPKPPGASNFDFSTASIETSPDDQKKIEQYLAEGDRAFDGGNYQQAIDLWSRIFLIDVTNEAASERIERAKGKRREAEQQVESVLAAGVQAFERKDLTAARAKFEEVLRADPGNVTAQDYMERLASPGGASPSFTPAASSSTPSFDSSIIESPDAGTFEEPRPIPAPKKQAPKTAAASRPAPSGRKLPVGLIAVAVIALVLIGGGYFAWKKFMSAPKTDATAARALLDQAAQYSAQGKYDLALSTLQEIKPGDPQYDKALVMMADLQQKKSRASATIEGRPASVFFQENVDAGRAAFASHDYVSAKKAFEAAMRVKPLPADVKTSYDLAAQQVGKLDNAKTLFAERKYLDAIAALQPLQQQDPQNKNIQRMIIDAHFNLGAVALQEEKLDDAKREFDEVLKSDPNDELAKRSRDLADRYEGQTKDLLYIIYVKYLPLRQPPAA